MKNLKLFFVVGFLSFFGACVPDVEPKIPTWRNNLEKSADTDSWGEVHNEGLDYIAKELEKIDLKGKDTNQVIYDLVLKFADTKATIYKDPTIGTAAELGAAIQNINQNHLSPNGQKLYDELITEIDKFVFDTINPNYIKEFQLQIYNGIENKIRLSSGIADSDRIDLLRACSLARYSVTYWYTEFYKVWKSQNEQASVWQWMLGKLFPKPAQPQRFIAARAAKVDIPKKDVSGSKTEPKAIAKSGKV